ncbi:MAG: type II toxin-antitoxin system RelE/ParE family toxin [Candidatus Bathyarchaeia archaeon]
MLYEIELTKHFERLFRKLNSEVMKRIRDKILELNVNLYIHKSLMGQLYGSRSIGDYRILYAVDEENKKVHIEHRRAVYK